MLASTTLCADTIPNSLRKSLLFHATFDGGTDAVYARGDKKIYSAPSYKPGEQAKSRPGLGDVDVELAREKGVQGDALRFRSVNTKALFYQAQRNVDYKPSGWNGTASFWLCVDPQTDLTGYSDPIQITDKAYNDAAIWVDFSKDERPRHFRLGVFGNLRAWNPENLPADKYPKFMERLVVVKNPPFSRDRWTHVVVTWTRLGGNSPAKASLYLDGKLMGTADNITEAFTIQPDNFKLRIGVNYAGLFDEFAIFDRPLTDSEVAELHRAAGTLR